MKRIDSLTTEQTAQLMPWANKWIDQAICTVPVDKNAFETAASQAYTLSNLNSKPRVMWLRSPRAGVLAVSLLQNKSFLAELKKAAARKRSHVSTPPLTERAFDEALALTCEFAFPAEVGLAKRINWSKIKFAIANWDNYLGGYFWNYWPAFERFFTQVCGLELENGLSVNADVYAQLCNNSGWFWMFENLVIATEKHTMLTRAETRLHNETGPAIAWADGYELCFLQGVSVPKEWVTSDVPGELGLTWPNVEQRRVLREKLGWLKVLSGRTCTTINKDPDPKVGELLEIDIGEPDGPARFLKMLCGTGRVLIERVDPTWGNTALAVAAARWGLSADEYAPETGT